MGRPLFSSLYNNDILKASIKVDDESSQTEDPFKKWSPENPFDPDSDDFFTEAVYEAFIDDDREREEEEEEEEEDSHPAIDDADEASSDVSTTDVEQQSPMAVGSDDPTRMLSAYAYISQWEQNYRLPVSADGGSHGEQHLDQNPVDTLLRTTDITPITIPRPTTPTHPPPSVPTYRPATPPSSQSHSRFLFTPSPAPTATPRVYGWVNSSAHLPMFPITPSRVGPLSNPDARVSLSHISHALPVHNVA